MRILHLLSQIEVTGAEVYAVQLAACQLDAANQVWIMSDTLRSQTQAIYIPVSLHIRTMMQRWKNVKTVRAFIKQHNIDVVHAHSRAAIWVGYFATLKTKTPLISTIHGRQKSSLSKRLWDMYGDRVITICKNVKLQIIRDLKINPRKISIIPNGVNFPKLNARQKHKHNVLTIAGRTTGPKGEILSRLLTDIFSKLLEKHPDLQIQLIGGALEDLPNAAQQQFHSLQKMYAQRLTHEGFVENLMEYLITSKCVIAAGRIAIEALAQGIPVIALGEALFVGLVDEHNIENAIASNFGDIATQYQSGKIEFDAIPKEIDKALTDFYLPAVVVNKIQQTYAITHVYREVMQVYQRAIIEKQNPQHIPILMYHKVLPQAEASQHKTFVTCKQFAQHMQLLAKHHFTPITFKDYFAFRNAKRPLNDFPRKPIVITFDDGYVNNLQNALPIMQQYGFVGVLFAIGNQAVNHNQWDADVGEPQHSLMNAQQLQELAVAGFEIGAHSLTHPDLTQLSADAAYAEIVQSKQNLENMLQQPVISFAYPYGEYNDNIKKLARKAGFRCAVATDTGGLQLEDDLFAIFRVNMMPRDHFIQFFKKTSSWYRNRYWRKRGK